MINCKIDDRELQAEEGQSILEVARAASIDIPTLCHHEQLSPYGACRLCLVEIVGGGRPGIQASCQYIVTEGLEVKTNTERVNSSRRIMFELLLARSPEATQIIALAKEYGVETTRITLPAHGKCILCGLCARACAEVSQRFAINLAYRGSERRVQTPFQKTSDRCIGCGACAHVCPTETIVVEQMD